jgi:hypothetical protein
MRRQYDKRQVGRVILPTLTPSMRTVTPAYRPAKKKAKSSIFKSIIRFFTRKRKLEPWELELKATAEAKRARRRERNIRWWSNDRAWEFHSGGLR